MHNNYLKFFNLFVMIIITILRPPMYLWILGFLYVQVIWNIWVNVKRSCLPYFGIKIFKILGLRIYGLHSIFRSGRSASHRRTLDCCWKGKGTITRITLSTEELSIGTPGTLYYLPQECWSARSELTGSNKYNIIQFDIFNAFK